MNVKLLPSSEALSQGADLWIIPDLESSRWTPQLDWYLNFQLSKMSERNPPVISEFLSKTLIETKLETKNTQIPSGSPLMIASLESLPNRWVVILPWVNNLPVWALNSHKIWKSLMKPSLRIFLPRELTHQNFIREWAKRSESENFTIVLD